MDDVHQELIWDLSQSGHTERRTRTLTVVRPVWARLQRGVLQAQPGVMLQTTAGPEWSQQAAGGTGQGPDL